MRDAGLGLLLELGAADLAHPGGNLADHLRRVAARLEGHRADAEVVTAGACHAAYGTAGYPHSLLGIEEREALREAIGRGAERIVYAYCALDRAHLGEHLDADAFRWRDRFRGSTMRLDVVGRRAVAAVTVANELDVLRHARDLGPGERDGIRRLLRSAGDVVTQAAWRDILQHT